MPPTQVLKGMAETSENFELGCKGRDAKHMTTVTTQDYDWRGDDFTYDWNSFGWRGP